MSVRELEAAKALVVFSYSPVIFLPRMQVRAPSPSRQVQVPNNQQRNTRDVPAEGDNDNLPSNTVNDRRMSLRKRQHRNGNQPEVTSRQKSSQTEKDSLIQELNLRETKLSEMKAETARFSKEYHNKRMEMKKTNGKGSSLCSLTHKQKKKEQKNRIRTVEKQIVALKKKIKALK